MEKQRINDLLRDFDIYLKSIRRKPSTINYYIPEAARFLDSIKGEKFDESDSRAYLANLSNMKDGTARKIHYVLRALFKSQDITFNVDPPPMEDNPFQPTIRQDGVRRVEIWRASENDLNREDKTIVIHTAKKGRTRTHLIPDEVLDHISGYDFVPRSDPWYATLFWGMIKKAGLDLPKGYGFHSIRRALYTGLTGKVDFLFRHEFLRWRIRGINIAMIYDQNPPAQIDQIVFANHPFLGCWR